MAWIWGKERGVQGDLLDKVLLQVQTWALSITGNQANKCLSSWSPTIGKIPISKRSVKMQCGQGCPNWEPKKGSQPGRGSWGQERLPGGNVKTYRQTETGQVRRKRVGQEKGSA